MTDTETKLADALREAEPALWLMAASGNQDAARIHKTVLDALAAHDTARAQPASTVTDDGARELDRLRQSHDFYKRRCDALQKVQSLMRDPERKAVCDILANGETYALKAQPASVADHLSRAAEPVAFRWLTPMGNGFVWTRWCDAEGQQPPADRKVEYAYTHPSEDARDLDAKDANRFRFWCGRTQCDLDHWRREIDDAMKESGNGQ